MPQGSSDREGIGPYGVRYNDEQTRFGDRLGALERLASAFDVRIAALEGSFRSHLDRAASDAERAATSATQTLDAISRLREDLSVLKAQKGAVQIEAVQRVVALCAGLVVLVGSVVGAVMWIAEKAPS